MDSDADTDTIIGLDVRGQVFYCNKTKLLNANNGNSYFSARFREDSMLDSGLDRVDDEERDIYKLDRDPSTFKYIMEYIDTDKKPKGIGAYEKNKQLWGLVREEALYFGLDILVQLLTITFTCSPEVDGNKGIMYWLGTKKGTSDYTNPYSSGAVVISGSFKEEAFSADELAVVVQYRPIPEECDDLFDRESTVTVSDQIFDSFSMDGVMMGCGACDSGNGGRFVSIHLRHGVAVYPTHYSIRNGSCYGMSGDWNLEASTDGTTWDVIHEARGKQSKLYLDQSIYKKNEEQFRKIWSMDLWSKGKESRKIAMCDYMEKNHRQTWQVQNTADKFYTYFRFISIAIHKSEVRGGRQTCLHGIGFEIYGGVLEEWEVESKSRIEQLDDENEKLQTNNAKLPQNEEASLNENDSLKARIRQLGNKRNAEDACLPK